jgi:hypothetical protein
MMPKRNEWLKTFIHTWMRMKNRLLQGEAGLQLSINSTIDLKRDDLFNLLETCHYLCTNQKIVINQDYVNIEFNVNAKQPFEIIFRFQVKPNNFFYLEEIIGLNYINDLIKCQNM